jgi:hypothetical protein
MQVTKKVTKNLRKRILKDENENLPEGTVHRLYCTFGISEGKQVIRAGEGPKKKKKDSFAMNFFCQSCQISRGKQF